MPREAISPEFWNWSFSSTNMGVLTAGVAVIKGTKHDATRLQGSRLRNVRWAQEWTGKTTAEGPVQFGLAWNLSAVEVAECMNADPQSDMEEEMEKIRRNLVILGQIPAISTASIQSRGSGESYRTSKLPSWDLIEGTVLNLWWMVPQGGTDLTTGMNTKFEMGIKEGWLSD